MSRTMGKLNTGIPQIPLIPVGLDPEIVADRQNLPIFAHRAEIIQCINKNQVGLLISINSLLWLNNLRSLNSI